MKSKINQLVETWPRGTVGTLAWLEEKGVSRQLADRYVSSGWLRRFGRGAYVWAGDEVDWTGALFAIQKQLGVRIHVGARTGLETRGLAHFLPLGPRRKVFLFGPQGEKLPAWFLQHEWDVEVKLFRTQLLSAAEELGLGRQDFNSFSVSISSPERAIFEVLYLVPQVESFSSAQLLIEGLTTLRPKLVQALLEACRFVKVKRLLLLMAEEAGHRWFNQLDVEAVDLGSGKRVIGEGGRFVSKYQISVPESHAG